MPDVVLVVGGRRYGGWKSVRVTRSIESLSGQFALDVSDRWGAMAEPWQIAEEDPCRVEIGGVTVIDGYVDRRAPSASATSRVLAYTGRDRAATLVDCSAILTRWTRRNVDVAAFVEELAAPFGIPVSVQAGLVLPKIGKLVVNPGDTVYEAIRRAASDVEVLLASDGAGGILITRHGSQRAAALVEGGNIWTCSLEYDGTERFRRYVIVSQPAGTDGSSAEALRVRAEAIDEGVRRADRVLLIRAETGYSVADARRRVDWEARIRAARSETATISVRGWTQPSGALWPLNAITRVQAPTLLGVDGDMLISQVEHSLDEGGEVTQLRLVRPDAFAPEPQAKVRSSGGAWKELAGGAL
jgi:prophage tail gpP-like protein